MAFGSGRHGTELERTAAPPPAIAAGPGLAAHRLPPSLDVPGRRHGSGVTHPRAVCAGMAAARRRHGPHRDTPGRQLLRPLRPGRALGRRAAQSWLLRPSARPGRTARRSCRPGVSRCGPCRLRAAAIPPRDDRGSDHPEPCLRPGTSKDGGRQCARPVRAITSG